MTSISTCVDDSHAAGIKEVTLWSDGSVHLEEKVSTCAWLFSTTARDKFTSACYVLQNIASISSYRSKLEGMYRGLKHISFLGLHPRRIHQWCDNEAAANDSKTPLPMPSAMLKPEADIILAMQHLRSQLDSTTVDCRHVYGHQDTCK
jgi:hypothetical protein